MPSVLVAPYLVVVAPDVRHFQELNSKMLRFLPVRVEPADIDRMLGINEKIGIKEEEDAIRTCRRIQIEGAGKNAP